MSNGNEAMIDAWNTVIFKKWLRFKHLVTDGLANHSNTFFSRRAYPSGARVLDIGCGFGDSTLRIAECVGPDGLAAGTDCAKSFIDDCIKDAKEKNVANATFFVADAENDDLKGPYDYAFARMGTMFFSRPGVAMSNIRKALKPGAEFSQIVWRKRPDNAWVYPAEQCVRAIFPDAAPPAADPTKSPGPFSMSVPDVVSDLLQNAGFERVSFERYDAPICIGRDLEESVEFAMTIGPAGEIMRLAGEEGVKRRDQVAESLRKTLAQFEREDGIWTRSSTWIVTARNPG